MHISIEEKEYRAGITRLLERAEKDRHGQPMMVSPLDLPILIAALHELDDLRSFGEMARRKAKDILGQR